MLTFAYSVFQGNVGTAYRQRAQLLVFYFIFVAVGFVLVKEKHEERKHQRLEAREALAIRQATRLKPRADRFVCVESDVLMVAPVEASLPHPSSLRAASLGKLCNGE